MVNNLNNDMMLKLVQELQQLDSETFEIAELTEADVEVTVSYRNNCCGTATIDGT